MTHGFLTTTGNTVAFSGQSRYIKMPMERYEYHHVNLGIHVNMDENSVGYRLLSLWKQWRSPQLHNRP